MNNHLEIIKHTLYPYQERDINSLINSLHINRKVCFQAITSYGKTISFSTLAKWYIKVYNKKVLVLCHREELISQSAEAFMKMGLTVEKILPNVKRLHHAADVYIGMERTLTNRIKKNKKFLIDLGLVIIDECHIGNFFPHIDYFKEEKIVGFTSTPVLNERITYWKCPRCKRESKELDNCCNMEMEEWGKPKTLSMYFDDIVIGADTDELIEFGSIVKDINYVEKFNDMSNLKTDSNGEYTAESQNKVFANDDSVLSCLLNYEKLCLGKKTMIFNPSSKVNKMIYDQFKDKGYNVRMYDSVNDTEGSRKDLVKWFDENEDAILANVGIFTVGFSNNNVQAIILNRAIGSLSLFMQICGRGARSSKTIYKDHFDVLDLGSNIEKHNKWSSYRDWKKLFYEGLTKDSAKKESPLMTAECEECGFLFPRSERTCPNCGFSAPIKPPKERIEGETILEPLDAIPLPNGAKIAQYTLGRNEDIHFAFKVLYEQVLWLFIHHGITKANFESNLSDGRLDKRLGEIIRPVYFQLISQEEFKKDSNRTLKYVIGKSREKICKYYNI